MRGMDDHGNGKGDMRLASTVRRRLLLAVFSGVTALLSACGGGGSSSGPTEDPSSAYTAAERSAATARVAQRFEQLSAGGVTQATWTALHEWVLSQPEFIAAGVGDQTLWAQFTDGRYFLYTDNWRTPLQEAVEVRSGFARAAALANAPAAAYGEVPGSADALILGFNDPDFAPGIPTMGRMAKALAERGWTVAPERSLTVDALKNRGELGFFYFTSHSAAFGPGDEQEFAVMTETEVTVASELGYATDLFDGSLIYHRDRSTWQRFGFHKNPRYAVTTKFVEKHFRFSPNSLVVMLSCNSGSTGAAAFRAALQKQGAGTLVGWNGNSNALAFEMADLLVDRLTGVNAFAPASPPNRAFGFDDVWAYLGKKGQLATKPVGTDTQSTPVLRFGTGFTKFNPIVAALEARGDKLVIHGDFGAMPGTVTVGGVPVTSAWGSQKIEASLANANQGEVVVTARERRSNPRVLASWRGSVSYIHESMEVSGCDAKFHNTAVIDLHMRADAHGVRDEVDGPVKNNPHVVIPAPDTRATWTAAGNCPDHTRWSGSGAFGFRTDFDPSNPGTLTGNHLSARIDTVEGRFQLNGVFGHEERKTVVSLGMQTQQQLYFDTDLAGFVNNGPDFTKLLPWGSLLPFGGTLNVGASQHFQAHDVSPHSLRVRWSSMAVSPAFDDKIGR